MIEPPDADEVFVREYLKLEGRDEAPAITAYKRAGYFNPAYTVGVASERILARPAIQAAINTQRKNFAKPQGRDRSRESVLADLDQVFASALADKDHSAAINAKRLEAQLEGMLQENVTVTHKMDVTMLTDEQLEKIAARSGVVIEAKMKDITPPGIGHLKLVDDSE